MYIMNGLWRVSLLTFVAFIYLFVCVERSVASSCLKNTKILSAYQARRMLAGVKLPDKAIQDSNLETCFLPEGNSSSCCSNVTENYLKAAASVELNKKILTNTHAFSVFLQENKDFIFDHYRSVVRSLVERLERHLSHSLRMKPNQFADSRIGASISSLNNTLHIFLQQQFNDKQSEQLLTEHLRLTMENIYENLFIATLLKSQHDSSVYHNCSRLLRATANQMPSLQDLTRRLNSLVLKTLGYTRTLLQSVSISVQVFGGIRSLPFEEQCVKALTRLSFCKICKLGHGSDQSQADYVPMFYDNASTVEHTYPCNGFCRNVIGGCLAHVIDVEYNWNMFVQNVKHLYSHIKTNADFELVANGLPGKLVDMVKHVAERALDYQQMMKKECNVDDSHFNPPSSSPVHTLPDDVTQEPLQIDDRLKRMVEGRWPFRAFPTSFCAPQNLTRCWNGTHVGTYNRLVPNLHIGNQIFRNSEMHIVQQPTIDSLKDQLEFINKKLQSRLFYLQSGEFGSGRHGDEEDDDEDIDVIEDYSTDVDDDEDDRDLDDYEYGSGTTEEDVPTTQQPSNGDFSFSFENIKTTTSTKPTLVVKQDQPRLDLIPPVSTSNPTVQINSTYFFIIFLLFQLNKIQQVL